MRSSLRLALVLALAPACTPISCERETTTEAPVRSTALEGEWPRALVPDLAPATPATEVIVERERVTVDNRALVATWPRAALDRARTSASDPEWPRVAQSLDAPLEDGASIPALEAVLARARRAERAGSEGGSGAGAFNLRVASDVPFPRVERVLYTAAQAGYVEPRILLTAGETERVLPWPSAPPRAAPTREQIEAALRGEPAALGEPPPEPRAKLDVDLVTLGIGERASCELEGALDARALSRCAARLRAEAGTITLEVDPDVAFERVAIALQALTRSFEAVRVTSRSLD